jgi:hypothetical protein
MSSDTRHTSAPNPQQVAFERVRRHVGHRVSARAGVRLNIDVHPGCTGTVAFVAAIAHAGVWIVVAWDAMVPRVLWYTEDTFLEGVFIVGAPVVLPLPFRRHAREFTLAEAFNRLGRSVRTIRAPHDAGEVGAKGIVNCVVADDHRVMLAVAWADPNARPDETWFSRSDYNFYLKEDPPA